jgi:hypothetical protein
VLANYRADIAGSAIAPDVAVSTTLTGLSGQLKYAIVVCPTPGMTYILGGNKVQMTAGLQFPGAQAPLLNGRAAFVDPGYTFTVFKTVPDSATGAYPLPQDAPIAWEFETVLDSVRIDVTINRGFWTGLLQTGSLIMGAVAEYIGVSQDQTQIDSILNHLGLGNVAAVTIGTG